MNVTNTHSRAVKTYTLAGTDGEVRPQPYSRQGRQYRVARAVIVKADGNVSSVKIGGPVLKKDGTEGQNWVDETFYSERDWPGWLRSIVKGLA